MACSDAGVYLVLTQLTPGSISLSIISHAHKCEYCRLMRCLRLPISATPVAMAEVLDGGVAETGGALEAGVAVGDAQGVEDVAEVRREGMKAGPQLVATSLPKQAKQRHAKP